MKLFNVVNEDSRVNGYFDFNECMFFTKEEAENYVKLLEEQECNKNIYSIYECESRKINE